MAFPVAILSFGAARDSWVFQQLDSDAGVGWTDLSYDLRTALKDPLGDDRVSHTSNGTCGKTMVAVMGQPKWEGVVTGIIDDVLEAINVRPREAKGILVPLYCSMGLHRSDVSARWLYDALQSLRHGGSPLLDVQIFPLSECLNKRDKVNTIAKAIQWTQQPWECPPPMLVPPEQRYGMQEARARPAAATGILHAWAHVDRLQAQLDRDATAAAAEPAEAAETVAAELAPAESKAPLAVPTKYASVASPPQPKQQVAPRPQPTQQVAPKPSRTQRADPTKSKARPAEPQTEPSKSNKIPQAMTSIIDGPPMVPHGPQQDSATYWLLQWPSTRFRHFDRL